MKNLKRVLAILLTALMVFTAVPMAAFATVADPEHNYDFGFCTDCGAVDPTLKFYFGVTSGNTVEAWVNNQYNAVVRLPEDGLVNTASVTVKAVMNKVASLDVNNLRQHSVTFNTGLTEKSVDLRDWLSNAYNFGDGKINATIDGNEVTYNFARNGYEITGTTDTQKARTAWQALTSHVTTSTQEKDDSYIVIANGSYIKLGTEFLHFEKTTGDLKLDNFSNTSALESAIRDAATLSECEDQEGVITLFFKTGTKLAVGQSIATLNDDYVVEINVDEDYIYDSILDGIFAKLRADKDKTSMVKDLINAFNYVVGVVDATDVDVNMHVHNLTKVEAKAAGCVTDGYKKDCYTCPTCGKYYSDAAGQNEIDKADVVISAIGHHTFGETTYAWADNGSSCIATRACTVAGCDGKETATATVASAVKTAATCTAEGFITYTATFIGTDWATTTTKNVKNADALGHSFTNYVSDGNATCTADGTKTAKCDRCDVTDTIADEGSALGHSFTTYVSNNDATCTADGTKTAKCDRCDVTDTITDEGSKLGHSFTNYVSDGNATCTADGTKTAKCDRCDTTDTIADEGSALGHSFTNYVSDDNATCTEDGTKTAKCDRCDVTDTIADEGSKLGHSFTNYVSNNDATCTEDGTKTAKCVRCDVTDTIADEGSALGHSFTNYVSDGNATCTEDGTKTARCDRCDVTDTIADEGSALGHSFTNYVSDGNATCTEDGTKTAKCDGCDVTDTITDEGSALGHTFSEATYAWADDSSACTATRSCTFEGCDETETATATVTSKVKTAATCTDKGTTTYTAKFAESWAATQTMNVQDIAATDHSPVAVKAVTATAAKSGLTAGSKCSVCGKILKAQTMTLAQSTGLKASQTSTTSITLKWTAINGAKYYKVEKYNATTKKWETVKTVAATTYTVTKLTAGTSYKFRVTALDSTKKISGKASATLTAATGICKGPSLNGHVLKASKVNTTSITLKWASCQFAKYYRLQKYDAAAKKWVTVKTTAERTYTVSNLKAGTSYKFRVLVLNSAKNTAGKTYTLKVSTLCKASTIKLTSTKAKTVTVTITKVTGAKSYTIYKSTDNKKWTKVTTTTKTSYNLTGLTAGKKIYVKVLATNTDGKASAYSAVKSVTVKK